MRSNTKRCRVSFLEAILRGEEGPWGDRPLPGDAGGGDRRGVERAGPRRRGPRMGSTRAHVARSRGGSAGLGQGEPATHRGPRRSAAGAG